MPVSSRDLYYQLAIRADDDGFIQPRLIMRTIGSDEDDLKVLIGKRFILPCEDGVVVIKHWLIHNMIRLDRYKPTRFQDQKSKLFLKENKAYTDNPDNGLQIGNQLATQVRLGKGSVVVDEASTGLTVEKDNGDSVQREKPDNRVKDKLAIYSLFSSKEQPWWRFAQERKAALDLFTLVGVEKVRNGISIMREHEDDPFCPQASTPHEYAKKQAMLRRYAKKNNL